MTKIEKNLNELKETIKLMTEKDIKDYLLTLTIMQYANLAEVIDFESIVQESIERCGGYEAVRQMILQDIEEKLKEEN